MNNPKLQKSKKKKNQKKSSKEISVRDHSDYKRYQKKMYAIKKRLIIYYKPFMEIVKSFKDKVLST